MHNALPSTSAKVCAAVTEDVEVIGPSSFGDDNDVLLVMPALEGGANVGAVNVSISIIAYIGPCLAQLDLPAKLNPCPDDRVEINDEYACTTSLTYGPVKTEAVGFAVLA